MLFEALPEFRTTMQVTIKHLSRQVVDLPLHTSCVKFTCLRLINFICLRVSKLNSTCRKFFPNIPESQLAKANVRIFCFFLFFVFLFVCLFVFFFCKKISLFKNCQASFSSQRRGLLVHEGSLIMFSIREEK